MTEDQIQELIDVAAKALCGHDEQRHRPIQFRTGEPCSMHEREAWSVVEALLPLIERATK